MFSIFLQHLTCTIADLVELVVTSNGSLAFALFTLDTESGYEFTYVRRLDTYVRTTDPHHRGK